MKIFRVFDGNGSPISPGLLEGIHDIPADAIEITEEEQNLYATNEYIRGVDGKPVLKPSIVPTKEQKQAQLDAEYEPQFADLAQSLGLAMLDGNQTVIDGIKSDYFALKSEYQQKREAIANG